MTLPRTGMTTFPAPSYQLRVVWQETLLNSLMLFALGQKHLDIQDNRNTHRHVLDKREQAQLTGTRQQVALGMCGSKRGAWQGLLGTLHLSQPQDGVMAASRHSSAQDQAGHRMPRSSSGVCVCARMMQGVLCSPPSVAFVGRVASTRKVHGTNSDSWGWGVQPACLPAFGTVEL